MECAYPLDSILLGLEHPSSSSIVRLRARSARNASVKQSEEMWGKSPCPNICRGTSTTKVKWPKITRATVPLFPKASGTLTYCYNYTNYVTIPPPQDPFFKPARSIFTPYVNSCQFVAAKSGVEIFDLLDWNPSLNGTSCALRPGFSYCSRRYRQSM